MKTLVSVTEIVEPHSTMRIRSWIIALALALAPAVVIADDHSVIFDSGVKFASFKTFTMREGQVTSKRPEINSSVLLTRLGESVRASLAARDLKETADPADLVVEFTVSTVDWGHVFGGRLAPLGPGPRGGGGSEAIFRPLFTEATLVLDIEHGHPEVLIWRGVFHRDEKNASALVAALPDDAEKLLSQYPVKKTR